MNQLKGKVKNFISPGRMVGKAPKEFEFVVNLKPGTKSVKQPNRPMHPVIKAELHQHLDELLHEGVIESSNSPWSSPIILVRKKSEQMLSLEKDFSGSSMMGNCF